MNYIKKNNLSSDDLPFFNSIRTLITPINLKKIFDQIRDLNIVNIRFKDAFLIKLYNANLIRKKNLMNLLNNEVNFS